MPASDQPAKAPKKRIQLQPKKPKPKKTRGTLKDGIRVIQQEPRIVLVAPHGVMGDDDRTDLIAYEAQGLLNCAAVINKSIKRDDTNLNDFVTASQCHPFFYPLERMLAAPKFRLVVWIHGGDENGENWKDAINAGGFGCKPEEIDAFIGYGQGSTEKDDRLTANLETAEAFRDELTSAGMVSVLTGRGAPSFRGWAWDNMNQYLNRMKVPFDRGQSLQIEIRNKGFRNTAKNAKKTAEIIFKALKAVKKTLPPPPKDAKGRKDGLTLADLTLAEEAYIALRNLFVKHVTAFMVEAGEYVIKTFYNDKPRLALAKNKAQDDPPSLKALINKIRDTSAKDPSRGIPSLSWFYNSVNLAAHLAINKQMGFQTFGILPHSHKLLLLHFPPLKDVEADKFDEAIRPAFEEKDKLAQIAAEKPISVRDFAKILREKYPKTSSALDLDNLPARAELRERDAAELVRLYSSAKSKIENGQNDVKQYKKALDALGAVIAERTGETEGEGRFQDWTDSKNNINICSGCQHDCLYCYMKPINIRNSKFKQPAEWGNWEIRQADVDKGRKLMDGMVGFPSSHDIFPEILDAYLEVLGKLLRAGNDVLIVSKPHLECIQAICSACAFFKDKILFRFTIGANDNDILSFWEPNALNYEHRKECLAYARDQGFHTSVSIEPMLDTARIEQLVADLDPLVNEDIWLGMMSHLGALKNWAKLADFGKRKAIVQAGQTPEILTAIYDAFSGNPKVKFKTETLKVILAHLKETGQIKGKPEIRDGKNYGGIAPKMPRFKEWEKAAIITDSGETKNVAAPVIVSATRRSDIPACFADKFMESLRRGHAQYFLYGKWLNVSFANTHFIVFWTKNPSPLIPHLPEIDRMGIGYYFLYTLNDYDQEGLEPGIPVLRERIDTFKDLSNRIKPERVVWRFDPLILADKISKQALVDKVCSVMEQLTGYTEKLVFSFLEPNLYNAKTKLKNAGYEALSFSVEDKAFIAGKIAKNAKKYGIQAAACANPTTLTEYGVLANKCIDDELIRRTFSQNAVLMTFLDSVEGIEHKGQREHCHCSPAYDIGTENTCRNGCVYCYANDSEKAVKANLERLTGNGEFLLADRPKQEPEEKEAPPTQ